MQHKLVLGGARSGKTRHGLLLAEASGLAPVYVATAAAYDSEMQERIRHHKAERDSRWTTVEEQFALKDVLCREARTDRIVMVDCLTLWLTNILLSEADCDAASDDLTACITRLAGPVIFISNEVGLGIVPDNALARRFRDLQGRLNQKIAASVDHVVFIAAGLPLVLK